MNFNIPRFLASTAFAAALAFSGSALADAPTTEQSIEALSSTDELVLMKAIDHLGALGDKGAAAVEPLIEKLKSPSAAVRAHAAHALGKIGPAAAPAVDTLVKLVGDPDPLVRRQAIGAIPATHPDRQKVIGLFVKLLGGSDDAVRLRVMQAIAVAGKPAVPGLTEALKNEKSAFWACLILRDMGPEAGDAAPALTALLADAPIETRREAILALAGMPDAAESSIPAIAKCLDEEYLRLAATFALGRIAKIPADDQAKILANVGGKDPVLSLVSEWALARANPDNQEMQKQVVTRLANALANEDPWVRSTAAKALIALQAKPELVIAELHKSLPGAKPAILGEAIEVLASLGPPAIPHLTAALKNNELQQSVAAILGDMGEGAAPAVPDLVALIDDENPRTANVAILALGGIGPAAAKGSVTRLIKALQEGEGATPHDAALSLGKMGPAAAAAEPALLKMMSSSDDISLRVLCAWSEMKISGKSDETAAKVLPELTAACKAEHPVSRKGAAELLGQLGSAAQPAVPALQALLKDQDQAVRDSAAQALEAIGQDK
ncbi:HEAT repeat domain-containing protein [Blastopirellula sp. J2-11]|uniref:HEAT repeat domain-containing protein n=1 Tax=Blastopirellula sp. J2-11 TaxID=2943192 RepID=UPI0021C57829|nr:HEAT repeat domain-containing protein [Blastopirellula sp. J2-11]UUO04308.1 HEAT repeat domain-containing protein [Blastopirellula sp. J2-11]